MKYFTIGQLRELIKLYDCLPNEGMIVGYFKNNTSNEPADLYVEDIKGDPEGILVIKLKELK